MASPFSGSEEKETSKWSSLNRRRFLGLTGSLSFASVGFFQTETKAATGLRGSITEFEADSAYGFNYPYFLYVPEGANSHPRPILIDPTNNPSATDDFSIVREYGRKVAEGGISRRMSDELGVPLLVPMFPRPYSEPVDWHHEIQMLDQETMQISSGKLEQVDLQLVRMIEHAGEQLSDASVKTTGTVLLNGFSASGNFVNRFTALHPDLVDSVTAGGINGTPILPREEAKGRTINYPIGIADFQSVTGSTFQMEAWREVRQLLYMGGDDENDTIPYSDVWNDTQREIALDVYGQHMQEDRMPYSARVYEEAGADATFEVYPNTGHGYERKMRESLIDFHRPFAGAWVALFESRPTIGKEHIEVAGSVPQDAESTDYTLAIKRETQETAVTASATLLPGEATSTAIGLAEPVESGESFTVALIPEGGSVDRPRASKTITAVGSVENLSKPVGGETEIEARYDLHSSYRPSQSPKLRVDTESGGATVLESIQPGDNGTVSADLSDVNGVPLMAGRQISLKIVDADPAGAEPLAEDSLIVATPDTPAAEVSISTADIAEQGDIMTVETEVRGLGGKTDSAPLQLFADGAEVAHEEIAISRGKRTTIETNVRTDSYDGGQLTIEARYRDNSAVKTVVLATQPTSGVGTESNPFKITSPAELAYLSVESDAAYELQNSLNLAAFDPYPIIGTWDEPFSGTLIGNYYTIRNLRIEGDRELPDGVGLFGNVYDGKIAELRLQNVSVEGGDFTGALVGNGAQEGTLSKIVIEGTISGESNVGGLIGGTMTRDAESSNMSISQIAMKGEVRGSSKVGGIIGQPSGDSIRQSYVTGPVVGDYGGGIIGSSYYGTRLSESYVAGLIGVSDPVAGSTENPTFSSVYWDTEATGRTRSKAPGATGLATDNMASDAAQDNLSEFDFESTWVVGSESGAYPKFQWEASIKKAPETEESAKTQTPAPTTTDERTSTSESAQTAAPGTTEEPTPTSGSADETVTTPASTTSLIRGTEDESSPETTQTEVPGLGIIESISALGGLAYVLKRRLS